MPIYDKFAWYDLILENLTPISLGLNIGDKGVYEVGIKLQESTYLRTLILTGSSPVLQYFNTLIENTISSKGVIFLAPILYHCLLYSLDLGGNINVV